MPFCPKCRYEYDPASGVSVCPDCDEKLVSTLPDPEPPSKRTLTDAEVQRHWVKLARLTSRQSADLLIEAFDAKGIEATIMSEAGHFGITGQTGPSAFHSIGSSYLIMVARDQMQEADTEAEAILGEEWTKSRLGQ